VSSLNGLPDLAKLEQADILMNHSNRFLESGASDKREKTACRSGKFRDAMSRTNIRLDEVEFRGKPVCAWSAVLCGALNYTRL
jgi:hypothetical protein